MDKNGSGHNFLKFKETSGGLDCFIGLPVLSNFLARSIKVWHSSGERSAEMLYTKGSSEIISAPSGGARFRSSVGISFSVDLNA